jgi:DNA polymerase-1
MTERPLLHVIDGSGYIFRAYYAVRGLQTAKGEPTNAVYGVTTMLQKTLAEEKPTHVALTFDSGRPSFRAGIYGAYKANRPPPPDDLVPQFAWIHEVAATFRIPTFVVEGYEADDVIATITREAIARGFDVRIVTADKDLMQLVGPHVSLYDPMRDKRVGVPEVLERFGVPPEQVLEVLALSGDATDNVPGVKGVGEKTATKLVVQHGSALGAVAAAERGEVAGKMGQTLAGARADVELSKQLVSLDDHVPNLSLEPVLQAYPGPDFAAQQAIFERFEFRRLVVRAPAGAPQAGPGVSALPDEELSADAYRVITTVDALAAFAEAARASGRLALEVLSEPGRLLDAPILGLALAHAPGQAAYVPFGHVYLGVPPQLTLDAALEVLAPLFADAAITKLAIELKPLEGLARRRGLAIAGPRHDLSIASYLLEPDDGPHDLGGVARRFLGHAVVDEGELFGTGKKRRAAAATTHEELLRYAAEQADVAVRAWPRAERALADASLGALEADLEVPLVPVLAGIELTGVKVDVGALGAMSEVFQAELARLEQACHTAAGQTFNIGSPKQLQKILFEELGLRIVKRTKTGPSTDHSVLEQLVDDHPLPQAILEYREVDKLKSTYVDALPRLVAPSTGRVHTRLNQTVAATGRLSSQEPNLQNIPIRTQLGRELRRVFVPEPGRLVISVDYSQIELRVLAHVSGDAVLTDAFRTGMDVHTRTASVLFDVEPAAVTSEQRGQAKTVNFGVLYGMGPVRLARQLGIPRRTAQKFVDDYFERQAGVRRYIDQTLELARRDGFVRTLLGRRRRVADIHAKDRGLRGAAERVAINTPIQGTAADLIKLAMLRVVARLERDYPDARLILQVHDELLLEAPEATAPEVAAVVKQEMEASFPLDVPLVAEAHWGPSWAAAH